MSAVALAKAEGRGGFGQQPLPARLGLLLQIGVGIGIGIGIEKYKEGGKTEPFFWRATHSLPRRSPAKAGRRRCWKQRKEFSRKAAKTPREEGLFCLHRPRRETTKTPINTNGGRCGAALRAAPPVFCRAHFTWASESDPRKDTKEIGPRITLNTRIKKQPQRSRRIGGGKRRQLFWRAACHRRRG